MTADVGSQSLAGRVAIVTGAAQGIGLATARLLGGAGATIAMLDVDGEGVKRAVAGVGLAAARACDVRDRRQVEEVVRQFEEAMGQIDILVNCAGIWRHTPVLEVGEELWDEVLAVNTKGILFCSQAVAPGMVRRMSGKIVNIASMAGFGGKAGWSAYCASKAAAISLTLALADELRGHNVHVNAVCPGGTRTAMAEYIAATEPGSDSGPLHEPDEVAREVLRLVDPFEQTVTGRVVAMKTPDSVLGVPQA